MHTRNDTKEVFYIGKGSKRRPKDKSNRNRHWHHIVKKHGYTVTVLAAWDKEEDALDHEKSLISIFKDMGKDLANYVDGGKGCSGMIHTDEAKKKMSIARKGNQYTLGYKHGEEARNNMRLGQLGRKHSEETKKKMSLRHSGENNSMWGKPNIGARKVVVCLTTGVEYPSLTQAALETGAPSAKITLVCQGKRKTTKGLRFAYKEQNAN
jgi:hypothetical protein